MAGLQGSVSSLARFATTMRALPRVLGQRVAAKAAPLLTELAKATFDASEDAYGNSWAPGAEGQRVTLRKSGALARYLVYVAIGTKLRISLGTAYAKFQIGKRPVFPTQGGQLPSTFSATLAKTTQDEAKAFFREGSGS